MSVETPTESRSEPPSEPPDAAALGYRALLRQNRNFRLLWAGQIVSLLGDWFNFVATMTLVAVLTGSGVAVGALYGVRMLAPFLVSPLAGVCADRFDRRTILVLSDIARAATVLCFLIVDEPSEVWLLYVLTFVQLALSGFFFPARNALLGDIVSHRNIGTANALSAATWSVMLAFGAAIGGVVAGVFGSHPAFVIDAATFLVSAAILQRMRPPPREAAAPKGGIRASLESYVDGLRYLRRRVDVLVVALHKSANTLIVAGPFQVVQVAIAERVDIGQDGGTGLGLILMSVGIGTGVSPILARRFTGDRDRALRIALAVSYLLSTAGLLVVGWAESFGVILAGSVLRGAGGGLGWVFSTQLLLHMTPPDVRGRVFATEFALLTLMSAIGSGLGGLGLDAYGVAGLATLMAVVALAPAGLWSLWMRRDTLTAE
jgi:MFS family permease